MSLKKKLMIVAIVLCLLPFTSLLIPLFPVYDGETYLGLGLFASAIPTYVTVAFVVLLVALGLEAACSIFGIVYLIKGLIAKLDDGDKTDKGFVFGCAMPAFGHALFGVACFAYRAYIPMAILLGVALTEIAFIFIHFKKLSAI